MGMYAENPNRESEPPFDRLRAVSEVERRV